MRYLTIPTTFFSATILFATSGWTPLHAQCASKCESTSESRAGACASHDSLASTHLTTDSSSELDDPTIVEAALGDPRFSTLVTALKAGDLVQALSGKGPFTVFAPTNAAFAKLDDAVLASLLEPANKDKLVGILKYHVVAGRHAAADVVKLSEVTTLSGAVATIEAGAEVRIAGAKIVQTDVACKNGIIHVIDSVMLPPQQRGDIVDVASANGSFGTLLAAAKAAGLVDALRGKGPLTVFAPTDAAFAKIDAATLESLLQPANVEKLRAILQLHVVAARVTARQAVAAGEATTLGGAKLAIEIVDGRVQVDGANVIGSDVLADNGVVHVIDTVLLPR